MSIASEITRLQQDSAAIAAAIAAKGVTIPSGSGYDDYATLIGSIPQGGTDPDAWVKDGDTHVWIEIRNDYQLTQYLRIRMIGTIDWGDGSAKDSVNVTSYTTFNHTYARQGKYRIDLHPTSGTFYVGGAATGYNIMGTRSNSTYYRNAAMYQVEIGSSIITTISNYAFYYATGMRRLYIPKTITTIGTHICYSCYDLVEVEFEDPSTITSFTATNNFYYCHVLQNMTPWAFGGGAAALSSCIRNSYCLNDFYIPATTTSMAANTLANMYGLRHLWCLPTAAPAAADSTVFSSFPSATVIHVPYGSLASYKAASEWSTYADRMVEAGTVKYTLTNCTRSNITPMVAAGGSYTTTITADTGKTLGTVTVKMGGTDITSTAYSAGVVTIASVTGNIEITASAS